MLAVVRSGYSRACSHALGNDAAAVRIEYNERRRPVQYRFCRSLSMSTCL